jgi:capsular exopolysaccharide synthesis family protein
VDATVLGEVPHFRSAAARSAAGFDGRLCYFHRPASREAEAYRSVRAALLHGQHGEGGRVIQISSPEPGDGKSVSASNLALALAQSGKRVLLIDADLRRPTVHALFRVPQEIGLADVLRREIDWQNAVRPTQIDGLSLMTAGLCPDNPAELLLASDLPVLLRAAREEYDLIIVDTPPILAVSDPAVVAPETDGMLLVVRLQKNKRGALKRTLSALDSHGAALMGIIANDVDPSQEDYRSADYDAYYLAGGRTTTNVATVAEVEEPVAAV